MNSFAQAGGPCRRFDPAPHHIGRRSFSEGGQRRQSDYNENGIAAFFITTTILKRAGLYAGWELVFRLAELKLGSANS